MESQGSLSSVGFFVTEEPHAEGGGSGNPPTTGKWLLGAVLPGHGEVGEIDGEFRTYRCGSCGHVFHVNKRCMKRDCPKCYVPWAYKQGRESAMRFWMAVRKVAKLNAIRHWRALHCVVSFVEDGSSVMTFRNECYRVARLQGLSGGFAVLHDKRKKKGRYVQDGYVHFHVVGLAFGDVKLFEKTDRYLWKVVENPKDRRGRYLGKSAYSGFPSVDRVALSAGYELTHCCIVGDLHAVTWFGVLKDRRVAKKVLVVEFAQGWAAMNKARNPRCPKCHSKDTFESLEDGCVDPAAAARKMGMSRWRTGSPSWSGDAAKNRAALYLPVEEVERLDQVRRERWAEMASYG